MDGIHFPLNLLCCYMIVWDLESWKSFSRTYFPFLFLDFQFELIRILGLFFYGLEFSHFAFGFPGRMDIGFFFS